MYFMDFRINMIKNVVLNFYFRNEETNKIINQNLIKKINFLILNEIKKIKTRVSSMSKTNSIKMTKKVTHILIYIMGKNFRKLNPKEISLNMIY